MTQLAASATLQRRSTVSTMPRRVVDMSRPTQTMAAALQQRDRAALERAYGPAVVANSTKNKAAAFLPIEPLPPSLEPLPPSSLGVLLGPDSGLIVRTSGSPSRPSSSAGRFSPSVLSASRSTVTLCWLTNGPAASSSNHQLYAASAADRANGSLAAANDRASTASVPPPTVTPSPPPPLNALQQRSTPPTARRRGRSSSATPARSTRS